MAEFGSGDPSGLTVVARRNHYSSLSSKLTVLASSLQVAFAATGRAPSIVTTAKLQVAGLLQFQDPIITKLQRAPGKKS